MGEVYMAKQNMRQENSLTKLSNSVLVADDDLTSAISKAKKERTSNILGLIGMFFIQGATLPSLVDVLFNGGQPPPITLLVGVFVGLLFYQARAIRNIKYEWVYVIGNTIGLTSNFILILYSF